mmetsp:Transcript_49635/g.132816  ORF Transcript_49635/g.132816 Transcript_49635/m.132816 type:complete len:201 (-) Transcript_49635:122-724(-)
MTKLGGCSLDGARRLRQAPRLLRVPASSWWPFSSARDEAVRSSQSRVEASVKSDLSRICVQMSPRPMKAAACSTELPSSSMAFSSVKSDLSRIALQMSGRPAHAAACSDVCPDESRAFRSPAEPSCSRSWRQTSLMPWRAASCRAMSLKSCVPGASSARASMNSCISSSVSGARRKVCTSVSRDSSVGGLNARNWPGGTA